jgi:hypothetical protein
MQDEQRRKHNQLKSRYLGTAAAKNDKAYVTHVILSVLISIMLLLTTVIASQKQNVYASITV